MTDVVMVAAPTQARTFQTVSLREPHKPVRERKPDHSRRSADGKCIFPGFWDELGTSCPAVVKLKVLSASGKEERPGSSGGRAAAAHHGGTLPSGAGTRSFHRQVMRFPLAETEK